MGKDTGEKEVDIGFESVSIFTTGKIYFLNLDWCIY